MILLKSDDGIVIPVCIWDGYNDKDEFEGCVWHSNVKESQTHIKKLTSEKGLPKYEALLKGKLDDNEIDLPKEWKGFKEFSAFDEIWYQGFEYSEQLYFTYKTENLKKTISLTGFEVVDGYMTVETWKASGSHPISELDEDVRNREYRRYLNGLLEYLMMMSNGKRIPVRPNMSSERKEARTIIRKQKPFSLKDVLGWQLFRQKGEPYPEDDKTDSPGHDCIEGRNHYLHRDYSPEEVKRLSTKINFNDSTPANPDLPETVDLMEVIKIHGMISTHWFKEGEGVIKTFDEKLEEIDKAA